MHESDAHGEQEWIIWNGNNGLVTTVILGEVDDTAEGRMAWLDEPFDMVGPFSLDELKTNGRIAFAECIVMSRQRWHEDQLELRQESLKIRRAEEERVKEKYAHFFDNQGGDQVKRNNFDEQKHRDALNLPGEGKLEPGKINAAFRRLAQKLHPDAGGSHEAFVRITEARNALLETFS